MIPARYYRPPLNNIDTLFKIRHGLVATHGEGTGGRLQSLEEEQGAETRHVSDRVGNTSPSSLASSTPPTEGLELPCTICCPVLGVYPGFRRPQIRAKKKKKHHPDLQHRGTDRALDPGGKQTAGWARDAWQNGLGN